MVTGAELIREQQRLSTATPATERQWATYAKWTIIGGTAQEVVIYATQMTRAGPADAAGNERGDAEWVDTLQVAYRMVLVEDGTWRLADRHVFEQGRHAVDWALGAAVLQHYQQLFDALTQAVNARDGDALQSVLDGAALEQYAAELKQLEDMPDDRTVQYTGYLGMIDVDPSGAVLVFDGTRTYSQADASATAPPGQPMTLVHRLEVLDGQWKIVDESEATTRRDADGTEHVQGCG